MPIPIVQSGPNRGKERSRNKNGRFRKKRSDAGMSRKLSEDILEFLANLDKDDIPRSNKRSDFDEELF